MSFLAPEPMLETNLFVLEPDLEVVTAALARLENLQVEDAVPEGWTPSPEWTELANRYSSLTERLGEMLKALRCKPIQELARDADLRPSRDWRDIEARSAMLETRVHAWQQRFQQATEELDKLNLAESQVQLLLPLDVPIEDLRRLEYQTVTVGIMPAGNVPRVAEALFQIPFILIPLQTRKEQTLLLAACSTDNAAILDRALKSAFFEPTALPPEALGRPQEALGTLKRKVREVEDRLGDLDRERAKLASELSSELSELWSRASAGSKLAEAIRRFPKHGEVFLISGWVPASDIDNVKKTIEAAAGHPVAMEILKADPNRQNVPSLVRAPRWLQPFEELVTTFGISSYNELDPTLIVTVSFLIMYGMMFGDLGHGLMLLLIGLWLRHRKLEFGILVSAAGVSGMLFGLLYGAAFGQQIMRAAWLRPLEGIWTILITAVAGGVVLLNIGFAMNLINAWRSRDWPRFFLEKNGVAGIALYWTLLGGGLGVGFGILPKFVLLLIPVLCAVLWLHEPLAKWIWHHSAASLGEALVTGFFELFEAVTGYASNSLSFIRLGAFAVAHEGLSSLVVSYSKGRWGWLVLLLGTVLVVGFEGVIVGIQALRLEYYEFFGRFFQGRGQPFVPLSLHTGGRHASVGVRA
jgi:V/A-type H+/Na+-transporting ATPase subunit I